MSAKPANRIPHSPLRLSGKRKSSQGPSMSETLVPNAKSAIVTTPPTMLPASAATISAE